MKFKSENTKGILIAFLGALLLTPDTLFMRLSEMDVWTMLFWRGFQMGAILILMTLSIKEYRENFFLIFKKTGTLIVLIQASGSVFFTLGIVNSSVALILFCIATGPLFAAFFSLIILKEKLKRPTIYASIFCLIGIIIVVTDPSKGFKCTRRKYCIWNSLWIINCNITWIIFCSFKSKSKNSSFWHNWFWSNHYWFCWSFIH